MNYCYQIEEHDLAIQSFKRQYLVGLFQGEHQFSTTDVHISTHFETVSIEQTLNRFWEVEPMDQAIVTPEHQACEQHFTMHTTQRQDGRFVVRLPLKEEPNQLGTSRRSAEHRLFAIERRLEREPDLKSQYHQFMKGYEDLGHMQTCHHM